MSTPLTYSQRIRKCVTRHALPILAGFAIVIGILASITVIGIRSTGSVTDNMAQLVEDNNFKDQLMTNMRDLTRERMLRVFMIINLSDPFEIEVQWERYSSYAGEFMANREQLLRQELNPEQQRQLERQKIWLAQSQGVLDRVVDLVRQGRRKEAQELALNAQAINQKVNDELSRMRDFQHQLAQQMVREAILNYQKTRRDSLLLFAAAVVMCIVIAASVVWRITTQGLALTEALEQLRENNELLETRVEQRTTELMAARTENLRMGAELEVSQRLQSMLLPKPGELARIEELDIAGSMLPAEEIGGDYYDVLRSGERVIFAVGDVTGHGLESGVIMLMVQSGVRTLVDAGMAPGGEFLEILNRTVYENLARMGSDKNLTLALLDYHAGQVSICGQHEEVLVVRRDGRVERVDTVDLGFPIGLERDIRAFVNQTQVQLHAGDGVVLYTDGLTEAWNPAKQQYGLERLCEVLGHHWQQSAADVHRAVIADVRAHTASHKLSDDITLVVFKRRAA